MRIYNVILSGGVGSRLWPLSRKQHPKQFLKLFSGKALFELTAERNQKVVDEIMVVGNTDHIEWSKELLNDISIPKTFITETAARNTAAAIAFAALAVDPDDILIVTPSDHMIEGDEAYENAIIKSISKAKEGYIVTFGIQPSRPETGYGYIEHEGDIVKSFREKPNLYTAEDFIEKGNFLWNSGMFCFRASVFLEELKELESEVYKSAKLAFEGKENSKLRLDLSLEIPTISVDYAVMERTKKLQAVIGAFKWSDMGSFESVYDYLIKSGHTVDKHGNMVIGSNIHTEFLGLKDCILVVSHDAVLVLKKEKSQDVKQIYENIGKSNYLKEIL